MGILAFVLNNIISDELPDYPKARGLKFLWFTNQYSEGNIIHPASESSEPGFLLFLIVPVYYIMTFVKSLKQFAKL